MTHRIDDVEVTEIELGPNVSDISPLRAFTRLKSFRCNQLAGGRILTDLSPLKDLKLTSVSIAFTSVTDLSPLREMNLTTLILWGSPVSDLSPLAGMNLTELDCAFTPVTDLTPLKGMLSMKRLQLEGTSITDLQPLDGMELEEIRFTPGKITRGLDILRDMKSLKIIGIDLNNAWASAEFWARYDKGEFNK